MAMMAVGITRPKNVRVAGVSHTFTINRMISGSRRVGIGTVVVVVFLPPPLMIVSIVLVIFLPMFIVMVVPPMVAVSRRSHWSGHTQPDYESKDPR